jgi:alpha-tubulin suppressor-like RCC1 family protein
MQPRSIPRFTPLVLAAAVLLSACTDQLTSAASSSDAAGPQLTVIPTNAFDTMDGGRDHACGLTSGGQGYCWGRNAYGQLGDSTAASTTVPVAVLHPSGVTFDRITAGGAHTCALTSTGQAYCWGHNADGRLGDSTTVLPLMPVAVLPLGGIAFTQLDAGNGHTCGLNSSGQAYCWGQNTSGQVGDSTINNYRISPTATMQGSLVFTSISAGFSHTCALDGSGQAYCWGYDGDGALGNGATFGGRIPQVVQQPVGVTFVSISSNYSHSCGLTSGGQAYCWGENGSGQVGDSTVVDKNAPVAVQQGALSFVSITTGSDHTCAMDAGGNAWCWGGDASQQLGNGAAGTSRIPVAVTMPSGVSFAFASVDAAKSCALDTIGQTWCWGRNNFNQIGDGTSTTRNVPTATSH